MSRFHCINTEFDPKGLRFFESLDEFLLVINAEGKEVPEVLVRGRSILTRKQGSKNSRDWVATLVDLSPLV